MAAFVSSPAVLAFVGGQLEFNLNAPHVRNKRTNSSLHVITVKIREAKVQTLNRVGQSVREEKFTSLFLPNGSTAISDNPGLLSSVLQQSRGQTCEQ